jgi:ankyrin repeat protein
MKRIESQDANSKELAKQALSWIISAKKPLTTSELQHALAVEADEPQLDEENLCHVEDVVSACAGLVTVDEQSDIIRLVHRTTQEYFERTHGYWSPDAHVEIARTCISYLLFAVFESGPCQTDDEFEERLELNQLYGYAAQNWGHHARQAPKSLISSHIMEFFDDDSKVEASVQALVASKRHPSHSNYSQEFPRSMTGSHLAAFFGLEGLIEDFTRRGTNLSLKDSYCRTPLSWAAKNGHDAAIALLVAQEGVDINTEDKSCETPLSLAAGYGHKTVAQLLLNQQGVDLESKDFMGRTPLSRAAMFGHTAVVEILLARDDIKPDSEDIEGQTPLLLAARFGHGDVVKLLLDTGHVDPEAEDDNYGRTPLSWAAEKGYVNIVEDLLSTDGINPDSKSRVIWTKGRTPLSYAAEGGHQTVIELLVQTGDVDPDSKDNSGRTPLSYAVQRAEIRPSKYLLEQGASPMTIDIHQKGLLHHAVSGPDCNLETIKMLLELGAPKDSVDDENMTPLHYTSVCGRPDIAKLIIQNEVPVDIAIQRRTWQQNEHEPGKGFKPVDRPEPPGTIAGGLTPLHYAALVGNARMVEFFLDHGANPNAKSQYGETPLHLTLRRTVLAHQNNLSRGANPDAQPQDSENPLHLIPWPAYQDSWEDDHRRLEYVLDLTDPGDDETFENVTTQRICVFDVLLRHPRIDVNVQDIKGASALHCLRYGYEKCDILISKLIEKGADLSLTNSVKQTPLHLACRGKYYSSVEVLLSHGADISHTDRDGLNLFHCAAHSTNVETMSCILEAADTSCSDVAASVDNSGRNALHHLLVNLPDIEGVRLLVRKGVDVNGRDSDGNTPLAAYLSNRWVVDAQICRLLLSSGSDAFAINHQGLALPHIFSSWIHPKIEVLKAMMDYSIDLAAKDRDGRTILHYSALNGSITEPILSFLLDKTRLCCEDQDSLGRTPKEYAVEEAGKKRHKFAYERKRWSRSLGILMGREESYASCASP